MCDVVFQFGEAWSDYHSRESRLWSRGRYNEISASLLEMDWDLAFEGLSGVEANILFLDKMYELIDKFVPLRNLKRRGMWTAPPPRSLLRAKSSAWARYKAIRSVHGRNHTQAESALGEFNRLNSLYRNYSIHRQAEHEKSLISKLSEAPKAFHSYVRRKKKGAPSVGPLKASNGSVVSDESGMSELLASAFSSVYKPSVPQHPLQMQVNDGVSMSELDISYEKVLGVLLVLNESSSPGPDGIHPMLLKRCAHAVALPLMYVFKKVYSSGVLPRDWRCSEIAALFKGGTKSDPLNYRPVSLTSVCCKVMERLISAHVTEFLDRNDLLSNRQFGFRRGRSTEDQLLLTYGGVANRVDQGEVVDLVFLDFSKAFDLVSHSLLLDKLILLGFSEGIVRWIDGFLSDRRMWVSVGGVRSVVRDVTSGVPQGSVLGPLLFLVYVNSLAESLQSEWYGFADDFKLYVSLPRTGDMENVGRLQSDLDCICSVSDSWNLRLNVDKCVVMRFGCRRPVGDGAGETSGYFIGESELELVEKHRDLGVVVDQTLKFHVHVDVTVRKASGLANCLLRSTVCREESFMVSLFVSHIRPILDYCSSVWNTGYAGDIRKLESVQRRWTRQVVGFEGVDYSSRLRRVGLYSIAGRMLRADLIKVWKVLHGVCSEGLRGLFDFRVHGATRGHEYKLAVPRCRTEVKRRFFGSRVVRVWNGLSAVTVGADTLGMFKGLLDSSCAELFYFVPGS